MDTPPTSADTSRDSAASQPPEALRVLHHLFDAVQLAQHTGWRPFRDGVAILPLHEASDLERAPHAALLRYEPGAIVPRHVHQGHEYIIVLHGSQRDAAGVYPAGTCVVNAPETHHSVTSDDGCIVLAIWSAPITFSKEEASDVTSNR